MKNWQRLLHWARQKVGRPAYAAYIVSDSPEKAQPHRLYLVGDGNAHWFAGFDCPCGCGELIQLNLLPDERPRWNAATHWDGSVTLYPSVWRVRGCHSHFWMRRGQIHWVSPAQ